MSPKGIFEYLEKKSKIKTAFIQGRIPFDLYEKVKKELEDAEVSWARFLTAACQKFVDDRNAARKNRLRG